MERSKEYALATVAGAKEEGGMWNGLKENSKIR